MTTTTIHTLKRDVTEAFEDWRADHPDATEDEWNVAQHEICGDAVPGMTTTLFNLAVEDNYLAMVDIEVVACDPFSALSDAVYRELLAHLPTWEDAHSEEE